MAKKMESTPIDFEGTLKQLESIVEKMEKGDIGLEEALLCFEEGIRLTRQCQQALQQAEQRVVRLMESPQAPTTVQQDS